MHPIEILAYNMRLPKNYNNKNETQNRTRNKEINSKLIQVGSSNLIRFGE